MSLTPPKGVSLRPYLPQDLARLTSIFRDAVEELAADDYDLEQRNAWIQAVEDEAKFGARIEAYVTLLAESGSEIAGFVALKNNETIELLYVDPRFARRGIASFLCATVELLAQGRKATKLSVEASDTAQPLFEKLGYMPMQRNTVSLHGEWLANTTMQKALVAQTGAGN